MDLPGPHKPKESSDAPRKPSTASPTKAAEWLGGTSQHDQRSVTRLLWRRRISPSRNAHLQSTRMKVSTPPNWRLALEPATRHHPQSQLRPIRKSTAVSRCRNDSRMDILLPISPMRKRAIPIGSNLSLTNRHSDPCSASFCAATLARRICRSGWRCKTSNANSPSRRPPCPRLVLPLGRHLDRQRWKSTTKA